MKKREERRQKDMRFIFGEIPDDFDRPPVSLESLLADEISQGFRR